MIKIFLCLVLLLSGCQSIDTQDSTTIRGSAVGESGIIEVELYIEDDIIEHIELISNVENPENSKYIIKTINEVMVHHTTDVEIYDEAFETSLGTINAIKDAMEKVDNIHFSNELENNMINTDLLIVGCGGAGLIAAIQAKLINDIDVTIIEKMPFGGGNTRMSGGEFSSTNLDSKDSNELFISDIYNGGNKNGNLDLIELLVQNSNQSINWLHDLGISFQDNIFWTDGHTTNRTFLVDESNQSYIDMLITIALDLGVNIEYNTKATHLIMEDDNIIGVNTKSPIAKDYYSKYGVILATGGYGANADMVEYYNTQWDIKDNTPTTNSPAITGDGIIMGIECGASLSNMDYIQLFPINNPSTGTYYKIDYARTISDAILVNSNGNQFVNEKANREELTESILQQEYQICFEIIDLSNEDNLKLVEDNSEEIQRSLQQETLIIGNLQECADFFMINHDNLTQTVLSNYGHTDGDFLIFTSCLSIHYTMGGLAINEEAQVLTRNNQVIDGLFAVGEVTGGIHGSNRIGATSLTETVVFGRIAAQSALNK